MGRNMMLYMNFDLTDLMNLKATSVFGSPLRKIISFWDAYDRSYPDYHDFINSIQKLASLNAIKVNQRGLSYSISNVLYQHMSFKEKIIFIFHPTDEFLLNVLNRLSVNVELNGLTISKDYFDSIVQEYISY